MLIFESDGKDIIIRGRDSDKKRYEKRITDFKPYFYVPHVDGHYTTQFGKKVRRITLDHPGAVKSERERFHETYESDVIYTNRYLIDTFTEIPKEPYRICFFDIETRDDGKFPNVTTADMEILSIAAYDNFKGQYHFFCVSANSTSYQNESEQEVGNTTVKCRNYISATEREMLGMFVDFVKALDFDILTGWNADTFDFPYVFNRMKVLDLDPIDLSPMHSMDNYTKFPRGRVWIDLMWAYRKMKTSELESYGLDYVSRSEIGIGKVQHKGGVYELYCTNFDDFVRYNIQDVWLMVEVEKQKKIFEYYDSVRRMAFCHWNDVTHNSRVLDFYFLKKAKEFSIVLPVGRRNIDYTPIEGARVIPPIPGIHSNVAVGDVRSLYPTAILTCNLSPETLIPDSLIKDVKNGRVSKSILNELKPVNVGDIYFRTDIRGFIPRVVQDLWDFRQELKSKMKEFSIGSPEYDNYDDMQTVAKFLLNSVYGVLLMSSSRVFSRNVGAAVTDFGRRTNIHMEQMVIKLGHKVIGGDTDAIIFKTESIEDAQGIVDKINDSLDDFCRDNFGNSEYNKMYVEFDKLYRKVFFVGSDKKAVKKRYAGLVIYKDGKVLDKEIIDIKGFEAKRSDTPEFVRSLQKDILIMMLEGREKHDIIKFLKFVRDDIYYGRLEPEHVAIPKGMSKPVSEYVKNIPAHVYGSIYSNIHLGTNIIKEKVKYIYVLRTPDNLPATHVISFVEKMPEGFEVNWKKMAETLIDNKFDGIFASVGWSINDLYGENVRSDLFW